MALFLHIANIRYSKWACLPISVRPFESEYYDDQYKKEHGDFTIDQFFNKESTEPETYISSQNFQEQIRARAKEMGHLAGVRYGEGFLSEKPLKISNLMDTL